MITEEYQVPIITNEDGFRDDPIPPTKSFKILLLGDSFAFGYGVARPYLFADLLEQNLGVEVINAATGGFDLIHQLQFLKYYARHYSPDLILYAMYLGNDLTKNDKWTYNGENIIGVGRPTVRSHWDIKLASLVKILRHRLRFSNPNRREWTPPFLYLAMTAKNLDAEAQKRYRDSQILFRDLVSESKKMKTPLLLVTIPYKTAVEADAQKRLSKNVEKFWLDYDLLRPQREIRQWAKESNIPFHDLTSDLRENYEKNNRRLYFFKDGHLNQEGHAVVAKALLPFLEPYIANRIHDHRR